MRFIEKTFRCFWKVAFILMENSFELTFFNYLAKSLMLWNQVGVAALQNPRLFPSIKPNQWVHFDCFLQGIIVNVLMSTRTHFVRVCTGFLQIWQNISFIFTPRRKRFWVHHASQKHLCCSCRFPNLQTFYIFPAVLIFRYLFDAILEKEVMF